MTSDPYKPQRNWAQKQKDKGFVKVTLWVPADCVEKIKASASRMRKNADKKGA